MSSWQEVWFWFQYVLLYSPLFWWIVLLFVATVLYPRLQRWARTSHAKSRFIESQGAKLENPANADVRFQLAHIYAEGRRWRRVVEYAGEAVRIARENPLFEGGVPYHFLRLLGEGLYHRRRYGEAVDVFEEAVKAKSHSGHADAWLGLGKARYRRGEAGKALEAFRSSLQENGSILETYFRAAQAAASLGKDAEVASLRAEFRRVAASLPRFARQGRLRFRLAFLLFPLARLLG